MKYFGLICVLMVSSAFTKALALEYSIGEPKQMHGMEIAAVYLQPVIMEPSMGLSATEADIHLEADISALEHNPTGFPPGAWIPDLDIHYSIYSDSGEIIIAGDFGAMAASDGPHYGANVKLNGPGRYHLEFLIKPPHSSNGRPFMRHVDKETGVDSWFSPFVVKFDFVYAGVGKKGGY